MASEQLYLQRRVGPAGRDIAPSDDHKGWLIKCGRCGPYAISEEDSPALGTDVEHARTYCGHDRLVPTEDKRRLSALLRERHIQKRGTPWLQLKQKTYCPMVRLQNVPIDLYPKYHLDLLKERPATIWEKINRALCNLARLSAKGGEVLNVTEQGLQITFAEDNNEEKFILDSIEQYGWVDRSTSHMTARKASLTAAGWKRFEKLKRANSPENPAFIAMWFGVTRGPDGAENRAHEAEMNELYQSIKKAVKLAGYKETRADLNQHNNFIMDEVIAGIKEAPFVIADLTGHRNGVYFEAGFARGLNHEVIHTCKETDLDQAHFDVKQINTIKWTTPEDIVEPLKYRILATIGRGPHEPETPQSGVA